MRAGRTGREPHVENGRSACGRGAPCHPPPRSRSPRPSRDHGGSWPAWSRCGGLAEASPCLFASAHWRVSLYHGATTETTEPPPKGRPRKPMCTGTNNRRGVTLHDAQDVEIRPVFARRPVFRGLAPALRRRHGPSAQAPLQHWPCGVPALARTRAADSPSPPALRPACARDVLRGELPDASADRARQPRAGGCSSGGGAGVSAASGGRHRPAAVCHSLRRPQGAGVRPPSSDTEVSGKGLEGAPRQGRWPLSLAARTLP